MAGEIKAVLDEASVGAAKAEPREDLDRHRRGLEKMAVLGRVPEVDIDAHPMLALGRDSPSR